MWLRLLLTIDASIVSETVKLVRDSIFIDGAKDDGATGAAGVTFTFRTEWKNPFGNFEWAVLHFLKMYHTTNRTTVAGGNVAVSGIKSLTDISQ